MTSSPNIYIFKYSADGEKFENDAIGQTRFQKVAKNGDEIIYEGSVSGNSVPQPPNSGTSNSKHQNLETSNKSQFSNKQTENKRNGYDSSASVNIPPPLTPPLFDAAKSGAIRNISSKFESPSLSNQMENINNARDISKYINVLKDEDNSQQSSLIQNKIKVFQSKIEKKWTNKDETVRKSNANLSLIIKDFGERREYKDLTLKKNTKVDLNKDKGSILNEYKTSIYSTDKDANFTRYEDLKLKLLNNNSDKKKMATAPAKEANKIYQFTNMNGEENDWMKKDGLKFSSVTQTKRELGLLSPIQANENGNLKNRSLKANKRPDSSLHNKPMPNGQSINGYNESHGTGKTSISYKSSPPKEIVSIQIITKDEPPRLDSKNQPLSKMEHPKIGNGTSVQSDDNKSNSVKALIKGFGVNSRQNPPKSSTWRGRPKSAFINTSIMSLSGDQGTQSNVQNKTSENNSLQFERKRRKSLNIDSGVILSSKKDDLGKVNQLPPHQKYLPVAKEFRKPQNIWTGYSERNKNVPNVKDSNINYKDEHSALIERNSFKFQNENSVEFFENNSTSQSDPMAIPIPPTPPSSPQNDPLMPSQFSVLTDNTRMEPAPKYIPKNKNYSPSSAELKNTLKKELEKKVLNIKDDETGVVEGIATKSLNGFTNHVSDSSDDAIVTSSSTRPRNKSLRSSIASGREKYEISFDYKMKDYETKDKITKKWDQSEKMSNKDSQFAASMRKLRQDNALDQMFLKANGPPKGRKFVPPNDETLSDSLSYAYRIGEKTKEEREFEEGWVSVNDAVTVDQKRTDKTNEPPVDYDTKFGDKNEFIQTGYAENERFPRDRGSQPSSIPPPPPPPPPPPIPPTSSSSRPPSPHIPSSTFYDTSAPPPPPPPPNNRSQRSTSSPGVEKKRKSDGFNLQPEKSTGGHKEYQIKKKEEGEKLIRKKDELLHKEPSPDYD